MALELPRREERGPVDARDQVLERVIHERADPGERRDRHRDAQVRPKRVRPRLLDRDAGLAGATVAPLASHGLVFRPDAGRERVALRAEQGAHYADGPRRVGDMDDRAGVRRLDLHRRVHP